MATYLIDTNIISYFADPDSDFHARIVAVIERLPAESVLTISVLTLYELAYGYRRHAGHSRLLTIVREMEVGILMPTAAGAEVFAKLKDLYQRHTGAARWALARHNVDLILASTAIVAGAVLVSH